MMGWPRQARAGESGVPVGEGMGQHGSVLLACGGERESGWFLPHGGGRVERGGGSCPVLRPG